MAIQLTVHKVWTLDTYFDTDISEKIMHDHIPKVTPDRMVQIHSLLQRGDCWLSLIRNSKLKALTLCCHFLNILCYCFSVFGNGSLPGCELRFDVLLVQVKLSYLGEMVWPLPQIFLASTAALCPPWHHSFHAACDWIYRFLTTAMHHWFFSLHLKGPPLLCICKA